MKSGFPFDHAEGHGDGLAATNAMAVEGIRLGNQLLSVISWVVSTGVATPQDVTDFTVTAGAITAATIDLSAAGTKFICDWITN